MLSDVLTTKICEFMNRVECLEWSDALGHTFRGEFIPLTMADPTVEALSIVQKFYDDLPEFMESCTQPCAREVISSVLEDLITTWRSALPQAGIGYRFARDHNHTSQTANRQVNPEWIPVVDDYGSLLEAPPPVPEPPVIPEPPQMPCQDQLFSVV